MSVDTARGIYNCHHAGCNFHGGTGTLKARLGIERERLPRAEYVRQQKARERAEAQARQFLMACQVERLRACERLRELGHLELLAHRAGPDSNAAWDTLGVVYRQRPQLTAVAVLLGEGSIANRRRWLEADAEGRERIIEEILLAGGVYDDAGRFVEVAA